MDYSIKQEILSEQDITLIKQALAEQAFNAKGLKPMEDFGLAVRDDAGQLIAAASGFIYYGYIYTSLLFVAKPYQRKGNGTALMQEVERLAKENGCLFATVGTMDFEAPDFYPRLGYTIYHIREGFYKDSVFYFFRKELI